MTTYQLEDKIPFIENYEFVWIAPNASVIGNVKLYSYASIWFGAVIRGDNESITIGSGSNIQDNSILHTDIGLPLEIGMGCTIGHGVILHGCFIGQNSLIGMGTIVLNGAQIGNDCLIGAGSVILEGQKIPDGSLVVGRPGKVIRVLTELEKDRNRTSAQSYQQQMLKYRSCLTLVAKEG